MYNILTGSVKMSSIFGALLISVNPEILSPWEKITKRIVDVFLSIIAILILLPVFIILSFLIKTGSKGPIIFKQKRIGLHGNPFWIFKFRSMITEAEKTDLNFLVKMTQELLLLGNLCVKHDWMKLLNFSM